MKQTGFRFTEEELARLDSKARALGVGRTEFLKILINSGVITSGYTNSNKVEEVITPSYTKGDINAEVAEKLKVVMDLGIPGVHLASEVPKKRESLMSQEELDKMYGPEGYEEAERAFRFRYEIDADAVLMKVQKEWIRKNQKGILNDEGFKWP